ncbi:MAG TPA: winged helix-turn-helix domain-containing protein [Bryobacteraceae bacterium]
MAVPAATRTAYCFGPFVLDTTQRVVLCGSAIVPLPPKAVCILTLLVKNAGEVVDKDEIFAAVWPGTFVVESSLTKNISLLRKTLREAGDGKSVIETVSKRGYRFVAPISDEQLSSASKVETHGQASRGFSRQRVALSIAAGALLIAALAYLHWRSVAPAPLPTESQRQYLIAQHIWNRLEPSEIDTALGRFERAAQLDSRSAIAYAGIAEARATMTMFGVGSSKLNLLKAREAATRALTLNPNLALPYVSIGVVRILADFDIAGAERAYLRALRLDPDSISAQLRYTCLLTHAGRFAEARRILYRAMQRDPVSAPLALQAARIEYYDRRYSDAIAALHELLDREPSFSLAHYYMAMSLGRLGRTTEALGELRRSRVQSSILETDEAWLHSLEGNREPARALLASRRRLVGNGHRKSTVLLLPAIDSGDHETALSSLEEMWKTREIDLLALKVEPRFDALRSEPRFRRIVNRIWSD